MIKPINKKFLLLLILLGVMVYLLKYPIEYLEEKTDTEGNISILTQIIQSNIKKLEKQQSETDDEIFALKDNVIKNTQHLNNIQATLDEAENATNLLSTELDN